MQIPHSLALAAAAAAYIASVAAIPPECSSNYNGDFQITVIKPYSKRALNTRDTTCGKDGYLTLNLKDGHLIDAKGRTGYIASNYQFQFDNPPQENAISVGGYSACQNGSLALADSSLFYQCLSGDFYNLYDRSWATQCQPILIEVLPCDNTAMSLSSSSYVGSAVSQIGDGQPQAPSATSKPPASETSTIQSQAPSAPPKPTASETSTRQSQTLSETPKPPVSQTSTMQSQAPTTAPRVPVSQISDGQPQAPTATPKAPVSQTSVGQPQSSTAAPKPSASQISIGQPQPSSAAPSPSVSPSSIGQPLPSSAASRAPVSQISDGQPQAPPATTLYSTNSPAPTRQPVSQISDGQPQAPSATQKPSASGTLSTPVATSPVSTSKPSPISAAGSFNPLSSFGAFVIAAIAAAFLL